MVAILAFMVFLVAFLAALVGLVVPLLPGIPLAALGALLAAWLTGFERLGWYALTLVAGLVLLAQLLDWAGGVIGARAYGASRLGLVGGVVGSLLGLLFFPPFGFLPGALLGAVMAELVSGRRPAEALRAGFGALVGTLGGVLAKFLVLLALGFIVFPRLL